VEAGAKSKEQQDPEHLSIMAQSVFGRGDGPR
jgi:hypothetical protein